MGTSNQNLYFGNMELAFSADVQLFPHPLPAAWPENTCNFPPSFSLSLSRPTNFTRADDPLSE